MWQRRSPTRHAACAKHHAPIYGGGSRSHTRTRMLTEETTSERVGERAPVSSGRVTPARAADGRGAGRAAAPRERLRRQHALPPLRHTRLSEQIMSSQAKSTQAKSSQPKSSQLKSSEARLVLARLKGLKSSHGLDDDALGCAHDFHVPYDRVSVGSGGRLVTLPMTASRADAATQHGGGGAAEEAADTLDVRAWIECTTDAARRSAPR
jgi:hypothetical protein